MRCEYDKSNVFCRVLRFPRRAQHGNHAGLPFMSLRRTIERSSSFQIRIDVGRFLVNLAANIARNLAIDVDLVASVLRCCFEDGAR